MLSKKQQARVLSHDLRQPLTALLLNAELLQKSLDSNKIASAKKCAKVLVPLLMELNLGLQELADAILIEAGELSLDLHAIKLAPSLKEVFPDLNANLGENHTVAADWNRLVQAIKILYSNLESLGEKPSLTLSLDPSNQRLVLKMASTQKFPETFLSSLFDLNRKAKSFAPLSSPLRFSVIRALIEAHEGKLIVQNAPSAEILLLLPDAQ